MEGNPNGYRKVSAQNLPEGTGKTTPFSI